MPDARPSQKLDEISKELETLRTQSLSHPEKAAEMLQDGLGQIQVSLKELTVSAGSIYIVIYITSRLLQLLRRFQFGKICS